VVLRCLRCGSRRTVADLARNILVIGLMIAVGYLVGFRFLGGAAGARSLALYGTPASLGGAAAWIGGLLVVLMPLSVWRYRRIS
jgi:hypothetical protein